MFTIQINNRLKDIKGSKDDFGVILMAEKMTNVHK